MSASGSGSESGSGNLYLNLDLEGPSQTADWSEVRGPRSKIRGARSMFCDGNEAQAFICAGHMGGHMGRHRESCGAHGKSRGVKNRPDTWPEAGGNIVRHVRQHMNGNLLSGACRVWWLLGIRSLALRSRLLSGLCTWTRFALLRFTPVRRLGDSFEPLGEPYVG